MASCSLPIELCELVIDFAALNPPRSDTPIDYPSLLSCALVAKAWLPRARYNLFYRVRLSSARKLSIFFAHAIKGVKTLALSQSKWLYPRPYLTIVASYFASITTLELFQTYFATGSDLARLIWSFPNLRNLECCEVIAEFTAASQKLPTPTAQSVRRRNLHRLGIDSCSATTTFIIRAAAFDIRLIEHAYIRTSFSRWSIDDYQALSHLSGLRSLAITMASPTAFKPVSPKLNLISLYSSAIKQVFSQIAAAETPGGPTLSVISIAFEPGQGPWKVLSGEEPGSEDRHAWTYEASRTAALDAILGSLEGLLTIDGQLPKPAFAALRLLAIDIWDSADGPNCDDLWWAEEFAKRLPALCRMNMLQLRIHRRWTRGKSLWQAES